MKSFERYYIKQHMKLLGVFLPTVLILTPLLFALIYPFFFPGETMGNFYLFILLSPLFLTLCSLREVSFFGYIQFGNRFHGYLKPVAFMMFLDSFTIGLLGIALYLLFLQFADTYPLFNCYKFYDSLEQARHLHQGASLLYYFYNFSESSALIL